MFDETEMGKNKQMHANGTRVSVNKLQTWTLATRQKSQTQTGPV
jgi:hypothetical protein